MKRGRRYLLVALGVVIVALLFSLVLWAPPIIDREWRSSTYSYRIEITNVTSYSYYQVIVPAIVNEGDEPLPELEFNGSGRAVRELVLTPYGWGLGITAQGNRTLHLEGGYRWEEGDGSGPRAIAYMSTAVNRSDIAWHLYGTHKVWMYSDRPGIVVNLYFIESRSHHEPGIGQGEDVHSEFQQAIQCEGTTRGWDLYSMVAQPGPPA